MLSLWASKLTHRIGPLSPTRGGNFRASVSVCDSEQCCNQWHQPWASLGLYTSTWDSTENRTQPADQLNPMVLEFGDVSALRTLIAFAPSKQVIWFWLVFRVWGPRMLNVQAKQINDVLSSSHNTSQIDSVAPFICRAPGRVAWGHVALAYLQRHLLYLAILQNQTDNTMSINQLP